LTIKKAAKLADLVMKKLEPIESTNGIITITHPALENLIYYVLVKEK